MGPVAGGVEGAVADIIGCFMKGYGVNPLITLSAVAWGVIPGLAGKLMAEKNRKVKTAVMCAAIAISGVVGTLGLTTAGLVMIGANFYAIMPGRLVQFAIYDSNLLRTYQPSLFQPAYRHGCRKYKTC